MDEQGQSDLWDQKQFAIINACDKQWLRRGDPALSSNLDYKTARLHCDRLQIYSFIHSFGVCYVSVCGHVSMYIYVCVCLD